jgi:hypothetical protein
MNVRNERFALVVIIVIAVAAFGVFLLRQSGTATGPSTDSEDYAIRDIDPGTDPEALPPILRNRAARRSAGEPPVTDAAIQSPIELELSLLDVTESGEGGTVIVGVRVKPLIEAPDMRWFVKLPEGVTLASGETSWEGGMAKGEEKSFQFALSVPDGRRYEVYGRAEAYVENGVVTRGAGLRIDLGEPDEGAYPAFERVGKDGGRVISYKGRVEEGGE